MKKIMTFLLLVVSVQIFAAETNPYNILDKLKRGNDRYVSGKSIHPNISSERRTETFSDGQHPVATIVSCADSRVPVEYIFDQGIGDLFVIRLAGNVLDTDGIGTCEYGTEHLHTPLMVVMGHTKCGAVDAVCSGAEVGGSIPKLVDNIIPAVRRAEKKSGLKGKALNPVAEIENVWQSIEDFLTNSEIARELVSEKKLEIIGAIYNIETGQVEWLGNHPEQEKFFKSHKKE